MAVFFGYNRGFLVISHKATNMITKLPGWILWGGAVLAFSAGCVNTAALMGFTNLSVSHVTGNVSLFSAAIAHLDGRSILYIGH